MRSLALFALALLLAPGCASTTGHAPGPPADIALATGKDVAHPLPDLVEDDPPRTVYTAIRDVRLLSGPVPDAACLDILPGGRALLRFRSGSGWARVMDPASRTLGWVRADRLTETDPAAAVPLDPGHGSISETF